ncbi:MAG: DUF3365 domain-containing protein [Nitrospirae bacterium]|nr:DUF3365 domain-containing protein [Nitrospirota bacterium]
MTSKTLMRGAVVITIAVLAIWGISACERGSGTPKGIPPETVADYVHAVIEADRTFYTVHIVERLQQKGTLIASENWRVANTLPLPAQFLIESSALAEMTGTKLRYRLIGLWPINKQNGPATQFEQIGLAAVQRNPDRPFTGTITSGQEQFFAAVYADRAVTQACIRCHNAHPNSPKRDFKVNDVMGGIVINIPLSHQSR